MRGKIVLAGLILGLSGIALLAQDEGCSTTPGRHLLLRDGHERVRPARHLPDYRRRIGLQDRFHEGDYVYINKGSAQGVKVGDDFSVVRPVRIRTTSIGRSGNPSILNKMGTVWEDEGRLRVVVAQPDVSIAQMSNSCNYMQRGDIVLPFISTS